MTGCEFCSKEHNRPDNSHREFTCPYCSRVWPRTVPPSMEYGEACELMGWESGRSPGALWRNSQRAETLLRHLKDTAPQELRDACDVAIAEHRCGPAANTCWQCSEYDIVHEIVDGVCSACGLHQPPVDSAPAVSHATNTAAQAGVAVERRRAMTPVAIHAVQQAAQGQPLQASQMPSLSRTMQDVLDSLLADALAWIGSRMGSQDFRLRVMPQGNQIVGEGTLRALRDRGLIVHGALSQEQRQYWVDTTARARPRKGVAFGSSPSHGYLLTPAAKGIRESGIVPTQAAGTPA